FDTLKGDDSPFRGFGEPTIYDSHGPSAYEGALETAKASAREYFGIGFQEPSNVIAAIEEAISSMWQTGWDPQTGRVDLFVWHFGILVAEALRIKYRGSFVIRDEQDYLRASLWWPEQEVEAFPFHKTYKRLHDRDGVE